MGVCCRVSCYPFPYILVYLVNTLRTNPDGQSDKALEQGGAELKGGLAWLL